MNVSEVLNEAADLIEEQGWMQWSLGPVGGPHCAIGAIRRAAKVPEPLVTFGIARDAVTELTRHVDAGVPDWNDDDERTRTEVVEALRACAIIAAAKEVDVTIVDRLPHAPRPKPVPAP